MQEYRLEVGLVHIDVRHGDVPLGEHAEDPWQGVGGALDDEVETGLRDVGLAHRGDLTKRLRRGKQVACGGEPDPIVLADKSHELGAGPLGDDLAVVDDADPVAEALGFLHVVGRVEHGHALGAEVFDAFEDRVSALWVYAHRRLVQYEELRAVQQADTDVEPALHATGELAGTIAGPVGKLDDCENLVDPPGEIRSGQPVESAEEREVLPRREVRVDGEVLRNVADGSLGCHASCAEWFAKDVHLARITLQESADHRDARGLAGTVRAEESVCLPLGDLEADPIDGDQVTEALHQSGT